MKYVLIMLMIMSIAMLGCKASPESENQMQVADANVNLENLDEYEPGTWIDNWELALALSGKLERPILINFTGSDWCPWCFKLRDEVFVQKDFIDYAKENLVLLTIDFPRKLAQSEELKSQNQTLQNKYRIQGYPTILLVDKQGTEIGRSGYQPGGAAKYVDHIKSFLSQ